MNKLLSEIQNYGLDGIWLDVYRDTYHGSKEYNGLTYFMREFRIALHKANPKLILTLGWVYCPFCVRPRTYNLLGIKDHVDYFVVRMFGMQWCHGKYHGYCKTCSQDGFTDVEKYAFQWANVKGLEKHKVVVIFGWKGHEQPCMHYIKLNAQCFTRCANIGKMKVRDHFFLICASA